MHGCKTYETSSGIGTDCKEYVILEFHNMNSQDKQTIRGEKSKEASLIPSGQGGPARLSPNSLVLTLSSWEW